VNDILYQYVAFTKICKEQISKYGATREAIMQTIKICKDRNILRDYLKNREKEVVSIMMTLYNQEELLEQFVAYKEKEAAKEAAETAAKKDRITAINLAELGLTCEQIAKAISVSVSIVNGWLDGRKTASV
jgi:DNA-binding transcriptional regulator YiaG